MTNKGTTVFNVFTLYDDSTNENWNKLTTLEDDLSRIVEVAQRGVGQAHGSHGEQGKEGIQCQWNPGNKLGFLKD